MSSNPYSPPTVEVALAEPEPEIPAEVLKKIKGAWVAGLISGFMTLGVTLLAMAGTAMLGFDAWNLVDVAFVFGLTYGIYRKSRACAVLMLVYFVISRIAMMVETGKPSGLLIGLIFFYYYARGISGTFAYRRLIKASVERELAS